MKRKIKGIMRKEKFDLLFFYDKKSADVFAKIGS